MYYDANSFLQGIAVGRAMRGRDSSDITSPICWNETGIYSYFYIQYPQAITTVTKGQFTVCHNIFCRNGELTVTDIEVIDSKTLKVICNISTARNAWVAVTNYDNSYLKYANGASIPIYGISFWVDDVKPWNLSYIEDITVLLNPNITASEGLITIDYPVTTSYACLDSALLSGINMTGLEEVHVNYTGGMNE